MPLKSTASFLLFAALITSGCSDTPAASVGEISPSESVSSTATNEPNAPVDASPNASAAPSDQQVALVDANAAPPKAGQFDWPCWRGPDGNGISAETGLIHDFPASGPNILWRVQLGSGFSGLSVSAGRLYTLFGEAGREKIVCFDADTGDEIWKIDADADFAQGRSFGPRATPYVEGNRLYVVGASGLVSCRDTADGNALWSLNLYDKYGMRPHEEGLSCSPLIDGERLVVLAGTSAFAFNKTTGELLWKSLDEKMNHTTPRFADLGGARQLLVLTGSNLVGLDPNSGREFWRHPQRGVNCASPVVGPSGQIFTAAAYGFGSQLVKVSGNNPSQVYKNNVLATHHATAVLYEGHLYSFHDRLGLFKCVDFATGDEKWSSRAPGKGKLIIADGQMIIITEEGTLVLAPATPEGYTEAAKARVVKGTGYTAPTLANGKLYVRTDQEMVCINMHE